MKLINIVYKIRNVIKNYRKYRDNIVYDKKFLLILDELIMKLSERACHYSYLEHILTEYYPNMPNWFSLLNDTYDNDSQVLRNIITDRKEHYNIFLMKLNDFMYNDDYLKDDQKDKMNFIIFKNNIK